MGQTHTTHNMGQVTQTSMFVAPGKGPSNQPQTSKLSHPSCATQSWMFATPRTRCQAATAPIHPPSRIQKSASVMPATLRGLGEFRVASEQCLLQVGILVVVMLKRQFNTTCNNTGMKETNMSRTLGCEKQKQ